MIQSGAMSVADNKLSQLEARFSCKQTHVDITGAILFILKRKYSDIGKQGIMLCFFVFPKRRRNRKNEDHNSKWRAGAESWHCAQRCKWQE